MTTTLFPARQIVSFQTVVSTASFGQDTDPQSPCAIAREDAQFWGRFLVLDGSNLIRRNAEFPRLTVLLSILAALSDVALDYIVYFDANTYWVLNKYSPVEAQAYAELVRDHRWNFVETNGGTPADPLLLADARDREAVVISCDRFRDFRNDHPWLRSPNRLVAVHEVRDSLFVGLKRCPLRSDLFGLLKEIREDLSNKALEHLTLGIVAACERREEMP